MKISILGINFHPEPIGISFYTTEMCEYLAERGHKITVFTGFPYYPDWKVQDEYSGKIFKIEQWKGIKIRRSYVYIPKKITTVSRVIHELSFIISSFINLLFSRKPDIIITISPALGLGVVSIIISKLKKVPFLFHIQDLQPDAAIQLGMVDNKLLLRFLYYLEKIIYKNAYKVSVISKKMLGKLINKKVPKEKIIYFPNWVDINFIRPLGKNNKFRINNNLEDKFLILYSGNIGYKQGMDVILDVAKKTKDIEDILFLIVGNGAYRKTLEEKFDGLKLKNVSFMDTQPKSILPYMLSSVDLCLVLQKRGITDFALPSKILNIMGCARPVIACANVNSALYDLIEEAHCGKVVECGNSEQLKKEILEFYFNREKAEEYGKKGREFIIRNFSNNKILKSFEQELEKIL